MREQRYKILILGGYGVFGGRLAELLSDLENVDLIIAGRNIEAATAFCAAQTGAASFIPAKVDRAELNIPLQDLSPDLIVDASGPFQNYGEDPYDAVRAAIDAGIHYVDFADGADFVKGIGQFDEAAKTAGLFVLSGVSSFPVLTAAVIRALGRDMEIRDVAGGIAPSPYAGVGLNVMRAVVSYAGGPVVVQRAGQPTVTYGLTESTNFTISPPGKLPLRNIRFSLVDVPDLQVLPHEYPEIQNMWMGAGPGPEILHRILNLLSKTRAKFRLPSFEKLSSLFYWVLNHMKFGEHRGGMFIEIGGTKNGVALKRSWHLLAEGDDGPFIPSMAIEAIVRKILNGAPPKTGARPAIHELELSDYDTLFEHRTIHTGVRETSAADIPLFQKNLGTAFDALPSCIQRLHSPAAKSVWKGRANIARGNNPLAQFLAAIFRFPPKGDDVDTRVTITTDKKGVETWHREFGGKSFFSRLQLGKGRYENLICESFGPITFALAMVIDDGKLFFVPRNWCVLGVPMPKSLIPTGKSFEEENNGKFFFDVEISAPIVGRIVHYRGWLEPE